ncbi:DUF1501 domain-containing protein [Humitalea sp. 24SJ18S-53]|uniref:DUF1501 domain-containing protein n=1 Tax=Humitalea sp. 24SJ18S-53 TaxID=3422307 RepID=UPI003D673725
MTLHRRALFGGAAALFGGAFLPRVGHAAGGADPRFLTVLLRGALDGLSAVPPIGDPDYLAMRGGLAMATDGPQAVLPAGGFFGINPRMPRLHAMLGTGDALVVQAVATPYRERSHFDGQNVLESGMERAGGQDGWLNRALVAMPGREGVRPDRAQGLALTPSVPLIIRGRAPVLSWAPQFSVSADADTIDRVLSIYDARDPVLAAALRAGARMDMEADARPVRNAGGAGAAGRFPELARFAAERVARPDGPRVAVLNVDGWDTHAAQGPTTGRLGNLLGFLDDGIGALQAGLGPVWDQTCVLLITEFGRTVRINGTAGTDHGTGTIAILVGGAVKGGRVVADWPGLAEASLYLGRDLRPTTDLRAVIKGILAGQFGVSEGVLADAVFPGSAAVRPMQGLIKGA